MRNLGFVLLSLLVLGVCVESAQAFHGRRVRYHGAYVVGYPAPAYLVPAPAYFAPVPVTPFYSGPSYIGPGVYGGPSPFVHPRAYPYYGW